MNILLTGGGTAGHINPALAMAETFRRHDPDVNIAFAASTVASDKAADLIPRAGYPLSRLHIRGVASPRLNPANLTLPFLMVLSKSEAKRLIRDFKPDLILGTGGFACWPVIAMGPHMGIPTCVHESNAGFGKAIAKELRRVDRIFVNFPDTARRHGLENDPRVMRVGNPHMPGFAAADRQEARRALGIADDECFILAFGGSRGAPVLNDGVLDLAVRLAQSSPKTLLLHGTGKDDFARMTQLYREKGLDKCPRVTVTEYIYDMPLRMAAADVVISRAGAMTISELALLGKAAVLIPSPNVADNHQFKNAQSLAEAGAALCVTEKELPDGGLIRAVERLQADAVLRASVGRAVYAGFACPDANEIMYQEMLKLCRQ